MNILRRCSGFRKKRSSITMVIGHVASDAVAIVVYQFCNFS